MFFVLIFVGHQQKVPLKILWRFDLIWLRYLGSQKCLFVCLFVCLFIDLFVFFCFNLCGTPPKSSPENFVEIRLDLLIYLGSNKIVYLFCLFVFLFVELFVFVYFNHLRTPTGIYPENFVKIRLDLAKIYRI